MSVYYPSVKEKTAQQIHTKTDPPDKIKKRASKSSFRLDGRYEVAGKKRQLPVEVKPYKVPMPTGFTPDPNATKVILVTSNPRSGSSYTAALITAFPNVSYFFEPLWFFSRQNKSQEATMDKVTPYV